jgi:hypothetical protein
MLHSLRFRERIDGSDSTTFSERRFVVENGSVKTITLFTPGSSRIELVWIPNSIISLKVPQRIKSIVFESTSHLTHIESSAFYKSSLQSIMIPSSVKILGSSCFSCCQSLSSMTFESNSHLTRIESEAFSDSSLQSIMIPNNIEILGSKCFSKCKSLSSITFESKSHLIGIEFDAFSFSSLKSIEIPRSVQFIHGSAFAS